MNFSNNSDEFDFHHVKKPKVPRDPTSHRIKEKRRRDRMNDSLAELSGLIPANYVKQGQGRIEKTEIIEMASKHIRHLQNLNNLHGGHMENFQVDGVGRPCCEDKFYMGFKECQDEVMRYYVEFEGRDIKDPVCVNISKHLDLISLKFQSTDHYHPRISDYMTMEDTNKSLDMGRAMIQDTHVATPRSLHQGLTTDTIHDPFLKTLLVSEEASTSSLSGSVSGSISGSVISFGGSSSSEFYLYPKSMRNPDGHQMSGREEIEGCSSVSSHSTEKMNPSTDSDRDSCNGTSLKENHAYKLKHNIMNRFSQQETRELHLSVLSSDTSSSSSREEDKDKLKRKPPCHKVRPHSSENISVESSSSSSETQVLSNVPLPAFVMNPEGTHYLPISIHPSFLDNIFGKKKVKMHSISHPISIPVNFDGPYIAMSHSPLS
ncbi:class E basic helix-loop-helix protein 40 [Magallana gigas]|uniref:class E basic helix-loop-helix protein 40 n=1 Tax=Magallana gigas TaxID=29159 RepID=UPI00334249AB